METACLLWYLTQVDLEYINKMLLYLYWTVSRSVFWTLMKELQNNKYGFPLYLCRTAKKNDF